MFGSESFVLPQFESKHVALKLKHFSESCAKKISSFSNKTLARMGFSSAPSTESSTSSKDEYLRKLRKSLLTTHERRDPKRRTRFKEPKSKTHQSRMINNEDRESNWNSENEQDHQGNTDTTPITLNNIVHRTIQSSLKAGECVDKLIQLKASHNVDLSCLLLDCCAELSTYDITYGLVAGKFCRRDKIYVQKFERAFHVTYNEIQQEFGTIKIQNTAKFFGCLLSTNSISWNILSCILQNKNDFTNSRRAFTMFLFQELFQYMGPAELCNKLKDPSLQSVLLLKDNPRNVKLAINFFVGIGLNCLSDDLRNL